jgi:Polyketide cyclase / dehydrase and lipid transport
MIAIAKAQASSSASPSAFFARWADVATWPEWNSDTEWVRLDGPFATGSTGVLKPKGGPKVKFVIDSLVPGREFVDVSVLAGARLTFRHLVTTGPGSTTRIEVAVTMSGPLGWFWNLLLGRALKASLQLDLDRLVAAAEAADEAVAPDTSLA